uniref:Uncharacterized protein n=1 Tax=viral metagenome TaxID=1070528 RepID=A0A6C0ED52_9ZZZZ
MNQINNSLKEINYEFYTNIDETIKNIILSSIFKYNYINIINNINNIIPKYKLCYQLKNSEIELAHEILLEQNYNLILVKKLYNCDLAIYLFKCKKILYIVNIKISTIEIIGIYHTNY